MRSSFQYGQPWMPVVRYSNFALFSCQVNGEPAAAMVALTPDGDELTITPLFVSVTPDMILTDHDGVPAGGAP